MTAKLLSFRQINAGHYVANSATGDQKYTVTRTTDGKWALQISAGGEHNERDVFRTIKTTTMDSAMIAADRAEASHVRFVTYDELCHDEQQRVIDNWGHASTHDHLYRPLGDGVKIAERALKTSPGLVKCDNGMGFTKQAWLSAASKPVEGEVLRADEGLTITERHVIADALNIRAQQFAAMAQDETQEPGSRVVWDQAAKERFDLAKRIVGAVTITAVPVIPLTADYAEIEKRVLAMSSPDVAVQIDAMTAARAKVRDMKALGAVHGRSLSPAGNSPEPETIYGMTVFQDPARPLKADKPVPLYRVEFQEGEGEPTFTTWETDAEATAAYAQDHGGRIMKGYFSRVTADRILAEQAARAERSKTILTPRAEVSFTKIPVRGQDVVFTKDDPEHPKVDPTDDEMFQVRFTENGEEFATPWTDVHADAVKDASNIDGSVVYRGFFRRPV